MSSDPLDAIRQQISAGDLDGARLKVVRLLHADPENVAAWELLGTLMDDPAKAADCYRQILRIDPHHSQAAARLAALAGQTAVPVSQGTPSRSEEPKLRCQQCGAVMEVRFIGEMREKRAVCLFCGHQVDVPDTFQSAESSESPIDLEDTPPSPESLSPDEVVRMAGRPLREEERAKCPKCQAVVSRSATRCEWCGASLN